MPRTLILLTGASRGFGKSLTLALSASKLVAQETDLLLTARNTAQLEETKAEALAAASSKSLHIVTHSADFTSLDLDSVCKDLFAKIPHPATQYARVYLFNNAGSLGKLDRMRHQTPDDISPAVHLNLTAPLALTSAFLRHFPNPTQIHIINISSLAAIQAFDCWGVYSATKAARDMYHKTIAVEEPNIRVLNYAPGPLNTDMQTRIREEMPDVPLREVYTDMHAQGKLVEPTVSAKVLIGLLEKDEYENGAHIDIYDVKGW
ncbi:sepiapterin reductase [Spizellomyces punctatus DAOM BR117]|uniref:Sepiapterin reductase n=1 Tax=Spizellomyces punctatus (strain DAOM BR117) TaxID=645134 RepID=A0A0L0H6X3_SPIPD|nr:sepiapterin reductase [Spizellomyces punctatus DAOM BR117]KNC96987.1 sepiapterin reductase [Spizellomyces punctatus DAOM BR117]|eukprot:XP_016605027.1 sepiapterin reductase [Spizellomyces punctatus DAOM BR117]